MGCQVMVVDDSKLARMVVVKAISTLHPDWTWFEVDNAEAALSLAQASRIDITILDYHMPGRDGLTLAADLRKLYPNMPLALITANSQTEIAARAEELGMTFLVKPNWHADLAAFLKEAALRVNLP
jgi:CheY-like chemotaxis protein